ncbi:hypothetical protein [Paenibacillus dendritiformis]|uniref:hypothetical protein n=1 Tax=Paenibacillus dendritiformis TaxID=130049 RepID=UPI0020C55654|nr:hypothetical protein [Paenibacillus dendritiformis]CAH8771483.1 hypothetical protein H7S4_004218 [Paenibacillus dendritiformis]
MSPHPEELLQIYIIYCPFASSRSDTREIPAVLQDSLSGKVVHIEIAVFAQDFAYRIECLEKSCSFADFAYRIDVSREMVHSFEVVGKPLFFTKGWRLSVFLFKTWHA